MKIIKIRGSYGADVRIIDSFYKHGAPMEQMQHPNNRKASDCVASNRRATLYPNGPPPMQRPEEFDRLN